MSSSTYLYNEDNIPYQSHTANRFKSSFYTFIALTPLTSSNIDESTTPVITKLSSYTSSTGLVSKYLDDCEPDRCANTTSVFVRESLEHLTRGPNKSIMASGSTP